ncbi:MAG: hypothetical protein Q9212_003896 [Teloschistes hypoglaucus]
MVHTPDTANGNGNRKGRAGPRRLPGCPKAAIRCNGMKRRPKNNSNYLVYVRRRRPRIAFVPHVSKRKSHHTRTTQSTVRSSSHQPLYQDPGLACAAAGLQSLQLNQSTSPPTSSLKSCKRRSSRMAAPATAALGSIPNLYTVWPPILDELETESSHVQYETVGECLPCLSASSDLHLTRDVHIRFLHRCLGTLPAKFVAYDPARPWLIYWVLTALSVLGEDIDQYRERVTQTLSAAQNASGGFGGGHGQISHCAPSYAAILSLAMIGGTESLKLIDRKALYVTIRRDTIYLDVPMLMSWLSARQHAPEGGFAGRTNKLVDGCYSFWVGGCWPFLQAAASEGQADPEKARSFNVSLHSHEGLTRYILACCQSEEGGLRDKPSKYPDAYHSCYVLAGLSSAQHCTWYKKEDDGLASIPALTDAFRWISSPRTVESSSMAEPDMSKSEGAVVPIHPIFVIPWPAVERTASWFDKQERF